MGSLLRRAPALDEAAEQLTVTTLDDSDRGALRRLVREQPVTNVVLDARLDASISLSPRRLGGRLIGARDASGRIVGAAFSGGNVLPVGGTPAAWTALGRHLATVPRMCSSIVGPGAAVHTMWGELEGSWGPARVVREQQPLLLLNDASELGPGDPRVRRVGAERLEAYLPAAAAMFTEELEISPFRGTQGDDYRARVAGLIRDGRAFARFDEHGEVEFKADLGAISRHTVQVQGVWVRPDLRDRGIGTAALTTVLRAALCVAPTVSLYVNDFNHAARRVYDTLGMRQIGTLATVLF